MSLSIQVCAAGPFHLWAGSPIFGGPSSPLGGAGNPDFGTLLISAPASPVIEGSNFQASPRSMVDVLAPCTHHPTYNNEGLPLGVSILLSPFGNRVLEREGASACLVNHVDGLPQPSW